MRVAIIGAGNRGRTYADYARKFPQCMKTVGVSAIRESRKNAMGDAFSIPQDRRFGDWSELFAVPKPLLADLSDDHMMKAFHSLEVGLLFPML